MISEGYKSLSLISIPPIPALLTYAIQSLFMKIYTNKQHLSILIRNL